VPALQVFFTRAANSRIIFLSAVNPVIAAASEQHVIARLAGHPVVIVGAKSDIVAAIVP